MYVRPSQHVKASQQLRRDERCDMLNVQRGLTMFSVSEFLDRAKAGAGAESDYRLAKLLGINHSNVSNWRTGRNAPDERTIMRLCEWSGDDADHVAACIQSMRAANDDAAELWRRVAARLQKGVSSVAMAATIALLLLAGHLEPVQAAAALLVSKSGGLYIMSNIGLDAHCGLSGQRINEPGPVQTHSPAPGGH